MATNIYVLYINSISTTNDNILWQPGSQNSSCKNSANSRGYEKSHEMKFRLVVHGARPVAAQGRDRRDRAPLHRHLEDAACGALHPLHRRNQGGRPLGAPHAPGTARSRFGARGTASRTRRRRRRRSTPGGGRLANGGRRRVFAPQRRDARAAPRVPRQAEDPHGDPPSRCLTNSVRDLHSSFKGRVSHLSERGHPHL